MPARLGRLRGPTPSSSSSPWSSAEYYITCFRCINSFRDGSGHRGAGRGPHNGGLVESRRSNRFFRGGVVDETSSAIRAAASPRTAVGSSAQQTATHRSSDNTPTFSRHYYSFEPFLPIHGSFLPSTTAARVPLTFRMHKVGYHLVATSQHRRWKSPVRLNVTRLSANYYISFLIRTARSLYLVRDRCAYPH